MGSVEDALSCGAIYTHTCMDSVSSTVAKKRREKCMML